MRPMSRSWQTDRGAWHAMTQLMLGDRRSPPLNSPIPKHEHRSDPCRFLAKPSVAHMGERFPQGLFLFINPSTNVFCPPSSARHAVIPTDNLTGTENKPWLTRRQSVDLEGTARAIGAQSRSPAGTVQPQPFRGRRKQWKVASTPQRSISAAKLVS